MESAGRRSLLSDLMSSPTIRYDLIWFIRKIVPRTVNFKSIRKLRALKFYLNLHRVAIFMIRGIVFSGVIWFLLQNFRMKQEIKTLIKMIQNLMGGGRWNTLVKNVVQVLGNQLIWNNTCRVTLVRWFLLSNPNCMVSIVFLRHFWTCASFCEFI